MNRSIKQSGVSWLGEVPSHWEVVPVKRHYSVQLGKMLRTTRIGPRDVEVPYLKAQHVQWFQVSSANAPTMWATRQEIEQYRVIAGDLLVCEGGEGGRCGIIHEVRGDHIIQNALHRVRALRGGLNRYLQYVINCVAVVGWFDVLNEKATIAHFTNEKFRSLLMPHPPLPEQRAIADYLDTETTRIDTLIEKKRRLIDLLAERRQAIITEAVTKGLDPSVAMKDSGVEWLGEIPAHWDVKRLKHVATIRVSNVDKHIVDGQPTVRLVNYTDVYYNDLITPNMQLTVSTADRDKLNKFRVLAGDSIITKDSETPDDIGVPAYVKDADPDMVCGYHLAILRPSSDLTLAKFIFYATKSSSSAGYWSSMASGLTRYGLKIDAIGSCALPIPPLHEQRNITEHLDSETCRIDTLVSKLERQIDLLTERRQAVITATVTGKLDVNSEILIKEKQRNL